MVGLVIKFQLENAMMVSLDFDLQYSEGSRLLIYLLFVVLLAFNDVFVWRCITGWQCWGACFVSIPLTHRTEGEVLLRFWDGCSIGVVLATVLRFGGRGGSEITGVVCVSVNGRAISDVYWFDCFGGAVTFNFMGIVGIRCCRAWDTLECIDDTQLVWSLIRRCSIFFSPSFFLFASFACLVMSSSIVFPVGASGHLSA